MTQSAVIRSHGRDDVLIATRQLIPGETALPESVAVRDLIPAGHKMAAHPIAAAPPCAATTRSSALPSKTSPPDNTCMCTTSAWASSNATTVSGRDVSAVAPFDHPATFMGYRRSNGKVGTRNYIGVIAW